MPKLLKIFFFTCVISRHRWAEIISPVRWLKPPTGRRQVPVTNCSRRVRCSLSNSRKNYNKLQPIRQQTWRPAADQSDNRRDDQQPTNHNQSPTPHSWDSRILTNNSHSSLASWKLKHFYVATMHQCSGHNSYYKTVWNINYLVVTNHVNACACLCQTATRANALAAVCHKIVQATFNSPFTGKFLRQKSWLRMR